MEDFMGTTLVASARIAPNGWVREWPWVIEQASRPRLAALSKPARWRAAGADPLMRNQPQRRDPTRSLGNSCKGSNPVGWRAGLGQIVQCISVRKDSFFGLGFTPK